MQYRTFSHHSGTVVAFPKHGVLYEHRNGVSFLVILDGSAALFINRRGKVSKPQSHLVRAANRNFVPANHRTTIIGDE